MVLSLSLMYANMLNNADNYKCYIFIVFQVSTMIKGAIYMIYCNFLFGTKGQLTNLVFSCFSLGRWRERPGVKFKV